MCSTSRLALIPSGDSAWRLNAGTQGILSGVSARVRLASGRVVSGGDYPQHQTTSPNGLTVRCHQGLKGAPDLVEKVGRSDQALTIEVELIGTEGCEPIDTVDVVCGSLRMSDGDLWMQRFGTWMPSDEIRYWRVGAEGEADADEVWLSRENGTLTRTSETLVVLKDRSHDLALLAGFVTLRKQRCQTLVETTPDGETRLRAMVYLENRPLGPGERVASERLRLQAGSSAEDLLKAWVYAVLEEQPTCLPSFAPAGWSDWQYFRKTKTEDDVVESLAALGELKRKGYPIEYVVIDAGFCPHQSEWLEAADRFPHGMPWLFDRMREHGLKPGIWFAPYITHAGTRVAKEHPEWLMLSADSDEPLRHATNVGDAHVIDLSVAEAMDWMGEIVRVMMQDWGADWLKLDGPNLTHYRGGRLRDPRMTTVEMVTRSLEVVRKASGDKLVEGEGYYGPSIGFVDVQRVNGDNHPIWDRPGHGNNGKGKLVWTHLLLSSFMHGRFWLNHSENVILRDFPSPYFYQKQTEPDATEPVIPETEMTYQLTCHFLSGAPVLLTDPMPQLARSPACQRRIRRLLPNDAPAARVVDEFNGDRWPHLYARRAKTDWEDWTLLGVLNYDDAHRDFEVLPEALDLDGPHHAFEFWTETYLGVVDTAFVVRDVPAHAGRLVCLRQALGRPQVLSTSLHLSQGAVDLSNVTYDDQASELSLTVVHPEQDDERLFLHVPTGYTLRSTDTNAAGMAMDARRGECLVIRFDGARQRETRFRFSFDRD